jgi:hypothetical protein
MEGAGNAPTAVPTFAFASTTSASKASSLFRINHIGVKGVLTVERRRSTCSVIHSHCTV